MNTSKVLFAALAIFAVGISTAEGQLNLVGGVSYAEALEGQWGIDARLGLDPPMLPVGAFLGADYFPASCDVDCSLWGWRAGVTLHTSTPAIQPFLTGAYVGRKWERGDEDMDKTGISLGVGLRLAFRFLIRAEATREFLGGDLNQWVLRVNLGF